ncbi:putative PIF1 DNA helicase/replication protein A1-like protein [Tanacetum coccineum]
MLSSITVVDTDDNPIHHTQLPTESNPSCPTINVVHSLYNSTSTRDMSTSATIQQNETNVGSESIMILEMPYTHVHIVKPDIGTMKEQFDVHPNLIRNSPCVVVKESSVGGNINREINDRHGPYTFYLNGHNHHRIGTLLSTHADRRPRFAQLYTCDIENEVDNQIHALNLTNADNNVRLLVQYLITMLNLNNPLVQSFRMARERFNESSIQPVTLHLIGTRQRNAREYNLPSEVVALVPGDGNPTDCRDVIIEERGTDDGHNPVKCISELHPSFMALQYSLLFPYGEDGFHLQIPLNVPPMTKRKYMSLLLTQKAEPPDLFVTMTCNLKWPEIQRDVENYIPDRPTLDRPDTITRVFKMKLDDLMEDISERKSFWPNDKISSTDEIDHVISAELHSEVDDPIGFEAVRTYMMHDPCGDQFRTSPCPYRVYNCHRRSKNHNNDNNNSRTPYRSILHHADEIEQYLNCRCISACEASWKLLCFKMHYRPIVVERLPFHEEGCIKVYFRDDGYVENVLELREPQLKPPVKRVQIACKSLSNRVIR